MSRVDDLLRRFDERERDELLKLRGPAPRAFADVLGGPVPPWSQLYRL